MSFITWQHVYGISWLGGLGFTMSIFIANLAFATYDPVFKVGVLLAFVVASVGGYLVLRTIKPPTAFPQPSHPDQGSVMQAVYTLHESTETKE